ncbi:MAG: hypothetical protein WAM14_01305 [Candidatus Nitrosopolaris sp.]
MRKQNFATQNKFKEAYEQAVEEALLILGKNVSVIINSYILEKYSIRLTDTGDNPKALSDALEEVIDGGSRIIQRRILHLLYDRIGLELPFAMTTNFEGKVLAAKKEYEKALCETV